MICKTNKKELPYGLANYQEAPDQQAVRDIIAHPLTDRKESAMYKTHVFVDTPKECLKVRGVRLMHYVALENDTPENFEIAFSYWKTEAGIDHYCLFLSSEIPERERKKYTELITKYVHGKYMSGARQEKREQMIAERFGNAGLLASLNYFNLLHHLPLQNRWISLR